MKCINCGEHPIEVNKDGFYQCHICGWRDMWRQWEVNGYGQRLPLSAKELAKAKEKEREDMEGWW